MILQEERAIVIGGDRSIQGFILLLNLFCDLLAFVLIMQSFISSTMFCLALIMRN